MCALVYEDDKEQYRVTYIGWKKCAAMNTIVNVVKI